MFVYRFSFFRFFEEANYKLAYVDLERVPDDQDLDSLVQDLDGVEGVILDLRGYPEGCAWKFSSRFIQGGKNLPMARMAQPIIALGGRGKSSLCYDQVNPFFKRANRSVKQEEGMKVAILIDEGAISHAEHVGLAFEAACFCPVTFIGSSTMGANGNVVSLSLPGGLNMSFTGMDVRHGDGRQLQRVGLVPHIPVRPTIEDVREGRDVVLDRAIAFLTKPIS